MTTKFIKSNSLDFHNYSIFFNNKKVNMNETFNIDLKDNINMFYVKTYWFKTKEYNLESDHSSCIIKIENLLGKKQYLFILSVFAILIFMCFLSKSQLVWNLTTGFGLLWLLFQLYIYSFGRKSYIKVRVEYFD